MLGVIVPLDNVNVLVAPQVHVVQVIVPILLKVPELYVAVLEHVKLNVAKLVVLDVCI